MKRIGILTFHCAHNYGAVLQAYATQELLRGAGHDVQVIDYRPDYLTDPYRRIRLSRLKRRGGKLSLRNVVSEMLLFPFRCARYAVFERFIRKYLCLSERVDMDSFKGEYDVILVGSDQVWNSRITGGRLDGMYMAEYPFPKGKRRYIADAVSMGRMYDDDKARVRNALSVFDAVSVREKETADFLSSLSTIDVRHIQDPVIQLDPSVWKTMVVPAVSVRPYIFVYRMRNHSSLDPFIRNIADRYSADVVEVQAFPDAGKLFRSRQATGVMRFLELLAGATYVVTTSFHGTVFSTIFQRPFTCFAFGDDKDMRQKSFLQDVGLEERMLPVGSEVPEDVSCCFAGVGERLAGMRREAADFIFTSMEKQL